MCRTSYERKITKLTKEVDIFCAWIDESEKLNDRSKGTGLGFQNAEEEVAVLDD